MKNALDPLTSRERVMNLLNHQDIDRIPCFSGMGNVLMEAINQFGLKFESAHKNAKNMATLAASTYKLSKFECAVVPFDVNYEAEALGSEINFHETSSEEIVYPTVKNPILDVGQPVNIPQDLVKRGRIPVILEAIQMLQKDVGRDIAIGAYVLGPYTLAGALTDLDTFLKRSYKNPTETKNVLDSLVEVIVTIAQALKHAGADYVTVREMGATSDLISPRIFKTIVLPYLETIFQQIDSPTILHICGNTTPILQFMSQAGADAVSIGQKTAIAQAKEVLGNKVPLLGNIDGFGVITRGTPEEIKRVVKEAIESGVDAIWPACDIWPTAPIENVRTLVEATKEYGS